MDVGTVTGDAWEGINRLVIVLWLVVPLAVMFGGSILLSLAIIPSLVSTGEMSPHFERYLRPLHVLALVSGIALLAALVAAVMASDVIGQFWPRWWI